MKVAVALFGDEISPRFDYCPCIAIVDAGGNWGQGKLIYFEREGGDFRMGQIHLHQAEALLCGGIRRCDYFSLKGMGINVYPGLIGMAADRFGEFSKGRMQCIIPSWCTSNGCRRRRMGRHSNRSGHGNRNGRNNRNNRKN